VDKATAQEDEELVRRVTGGDDVIDKRKPPSGTGENGKLLVDGRVVHARYPGVADDQVQELGLFRGSSIGADDRITIIWIVPRAGTRP
jgi:hypothetical protein